jgi:hypothetical protein
LITIVDTIRALSDLVETLFGEAPTTKDITEGFDRPCTYIQPVDIQSDRTETLRHDVYAMELIRFATRSHQGWAELLHAQELLADALSRPIPISGSFSIYPQEVSFSLRREDMVLLCSFRLENIQTMETDQDKDLMETASLHRKD